MKRLTKGKVYLYKASPIIDGSNFWIMFRVNKVHYRDTIDGRRYNYDITVISDKSDDDLHWQRGLRIDKFSIDGGYGNCQEVPESEYVLYCLEDDEE